MGYQPFLNDIDLTLKCAKNEIKIECASWSSSDVVKDGFNKSHIKINDGDNEQTTNYGLHFALINLFNGSLVKYKYFDLHSSQSNVKPLIEYVKDLPLYHLIVITTYYNSGKYWKDEIYHALKPYGWTWKKVEEYESFIFVANTDSTVYYHKKRMKSYGPLKKELFIPLNPTPNIQIKARFDSESKIKGKWNFALPKNNSLWTNYVESMIKDKETKSNYFD